MATSAVKDKRLTVRDIAERIQCSTDLDIDAVAVENVSVERSYRLLRLLFILHMLSTTMFSTLISIILIMIIIIEFR